jgi:hypothetical protein
LTVDQANTINIMRDRYIVNSKPTIIRQIITLMSIFAAFGTNIVANVNPPSGLTIGQISHQFFGDILITPANYAFAIWGMIYLGLISFAIYQALPAQRSNILLHQIGYKLAIASLAQVVWVFCFLSRHYASSFLAMLCILFSLIAVYWRLPFRSNNHNHVSRKDRWLIRLPISMYLSWISVATIVNGATVLKYWQWDGWGISAEIWTIIMLLLAAFITHLVSIPRLDFFYAGVFVWALTAIAINNADKLVVSGVAIGLSLTLIILILSFSFYAPNYRNIENN